MFVPEDLHDVLQYLDSHQTGVHLIANGTDLINRIQRKQVTPKTLVDLTGLSEFRYVKKESGIIKIGGLTTISDLTASHILDSQYDVFREVAMKFGGPSIINMATVGGNICSASSSEDLLPVLLVLDAEVHVRNIHGERTLGVEDFVNEKRKIDLKPNELLTETSFKELDPRSACSFEKVGMRNSLIIAFVNCAVYLKLAENRLCEEVRIAFNRVGGKIPQRARQTEKIMQGKKITEQLLSDALTTLRIELKLSSDFRVSEEYRLDVACAIFKRTVGRCADMLAGEEILV